MWLDQAVAAAGVRLEARSTVDSTNGEALARARRGERGPLWITAERQIAGRGRQGRTWISEPGNLYASLLLNDPSDPDRAAELSFVAALAVHDAIVEAAAALGPRLALKWPNDVLAGGAKVAGILVEGESGNERSLAVVVGIGVNCSSHPPRTDFPSTDLAAAGALVPPQSLFAILSRTMWERLSQWDRGAGFASIRAAWLKRAAGMGDEIRVKLPNRELCGRFDRLDEAGRLVVALPGGGTEIVTAGDVFPLDALPAFLRE